MGHHDQLGHLAEAEAQDEARRATAAVQKAGSDPFPAFLPGKHTKSY